jgi:hypothetical protein
MPLLSVLRFLVSALPAPVRARLDAAARGRAEQRAERRRARLLAQARP